MRGCAIMFIFHAVVNVLITGQVAEIGQERVAAVKHTQLHLFKRNDIRNQFRTGLFPLWTSGDEIIFYHPLAERLAGDTCRIAYAGQLFNFIQRFSRDGGHNTVHHG
ncbi:Uncharacterised protein [Enterobacter cloacae]|nr:Uncharacterised protein [Enterobacter cloacae]